MQILDLILRILDKTDGRDQFSKLLQYNFLTLSGLLQIIKKYEGAIKFQALFGSLI